MKKILLPFIGFLMGLPAFAQTETEPNNTIPTANVAEYAEPMDGSLSAADIDNFRLPLTWPANLYFEVEFTNNDATPKTVTSKIYNSLLIGGNYVGNIDQRSFVVNPGDTYTDIFSVCGLYMDNYFLQLSANGNFNYKFTWYPSNAGYDDGSNNNTPGTATAFSFNELKEGTIGYAYWGNNTFDNTDYFTTTLPAANYEDVTFKITAVSNNCNNGPGNLQYSLYKNGSSIPFTTGYVGDDNSTTPYQQLASVIPLNNMQQGDVLLVKLVSTNAFTYKLKYSAPGFFEPDEEPNDDAFHALPLAPGTFATGNVGEYDYFSATYLDEYDVYSITVPQAGSISIPFWVRNDECKSGSYSFTCDVLDQWGNELSGSELMYSDYDPPCDEVKADTVKIRAFAGGTYFLRFHTKYSYDQAWKLSYRFKYDFTDAYTGIEIEPNNTQPTATPSNAGDTLRGHINFMAHGGNYDQRDVYKLELTGLNKLVIHSKAKFRGDYESTGYDYSLRFNIPNGGSYLYNPSAYQSLYPDSTYTMTDTTCIMGPGTNYIELNSNYGSRWEYEFSYEILPVLPNYTETEMEPNDDRTQAQHIIPGTSYNGSLEVRPVALTYDYYDYYQVKYPAQDSLVITVKAKNISCYNNYSLGIQGYRNASTSSLFNSNSPSLAAGDSATFVIRRLVTAGDSITFRFTSTVPFLYEFSTKTIKPFSTFSITGDSTACMNTYTYTAVNTNSIVTAYNWSLPDGGGTINSSDSIASVTWTSTGNRRLQLSLSNSAGTSSTKTMNVIINGIPPTQVPVMLDFARTLSVQTLPPGANCQWYRNNQAIEGATATLYYAALAGTYHVRYVNDCGPGPLSNNKTYNADAIVQTISLPAIDTQYMAPGLKLQLNATAGSTLPVNYQVISGPGSMALDTLMIGGTGSVIVKVVQAGNDVFQPAEALDTIIVKKGNQTLVFDSIPTLYFNPGDIYYLPSGSSSSGLTTYFNILSGNAASNGWRFNKTGVGNVTASAYQPGNADYNAATPVERTFCISIVNLPEIQGEANPCIASYRYNALRVPGASYVWTLSSGGVLTTNKDTAWIQWQTPGAHTLKVKAKSPCDTAWTNEVIMNINTSNAAPGLVSNMLPANHARNQQLPLNLSWIAGDHTVNYDLYVWDSTQAQPATPYKTNISTVNYTLPLNSFAYNTTYKWRVISKNPCHQTAGPVQHFRLIPLPDLVVSNIQFPATANSGQTISISWTVTNSGPGNTLTTEKWKDAVFFSFDTLPNFAWSPEWDPHSWSSLTAGGRPLLAGTKQNLTALNVGQSYNNSINFTLPLNYNQPLYVYVLADYGNNASSPLQVTKLNDTLRAAQPMNIALSPTPDLRVDSVFAPISAFSGSNIQLSYRVRNYGFLTAVGSSWTDSVFISQNPLFDRQQCIPVQLRNSRDQYYPNMENASAGISQQLNTDSSYSRNLEVLIPNNIFGTWFIYVKTNAKTTAALYEGAYSENNINKAAVQVYLTPTPKLVVQDFGLPLSQAGITQPIGVNWNIRNEGFYDNLEKKQGHYLYAISSTCPCYTSLPNSVCSGPPIFHDNPQWGSSYWVDRVYLSTNPAALIVNEALLLNEYKHGSRQFPGIDFAFPWNTCGNTATAGYHNVATALKPNTIYPGNYNFKVPSNLAEGNYYVYVYTNPSKTVFEYPGTAQIKRSSAAINIKRPDVSITNVSVPANISGGTNFLIQYNVSNSSTSQVYNHVRKDRIYVSNFPAFDVSAELIATQTFTEDIPVGGVLTKSYSHHFSANTTGAKYFYVHTNYDSSFTETNYTNNRNATGVQALISAAVPGDLFVQSAVWPDTVFAMTPTLLTYTVKNNGAGTITGPVTDSVYASCSPSFSYQNSFFVAVKTRSRTLATDSSYTDTMQFHISQFSFEKNLCFPKSNFSNAYFFIKTNANNGVYEATNVNNNLSAGSAKILKNLTVDHIVKNITAPDTVIVGRPLPVSYTLQNLGYKPNPDYGSWNYYYWYNDGVFISTDSVYSSSAVPIISYLHYATLKRFDTLRLNKQPVIPDMPTGNYYVLINTNHKNSIPAEINLSNNFNLVRNAAGAAKKIHIYRPNLPDLKDSIVYATSTVAVGQPITLIRKVTNIGTGPTYPANYGNEVFLSDDFQYQVHSDELLKTSYKSTVLQPGASYMDTVTATIRLSTVPGNYVLIDQADAGNKIVEPVESNNLAMSNLVVFSPPVVDLQVLKISHPDTVLLGYTMDTVKWTIRNESANTARGQSADGIYLSPLNVLDSTATLMQVVNKTLDLAPASNDSSRLAPIIKNVSEGNYFVIVKTDLLDNIAESDKTNNAGISSRSVYVKVKELPFNITESNTLQNRERYYKLLIPDSLRGATIRVTLKSNDSLTMKNEMFIAGGYVPTAAHYQYKFETPNYGNQQIVISSVVDSVYYIMFRCASANPVLQQVKITAVKLPFAVLNVHSNTGANIGNVTVKINGSLFGTGMTARLRIAGDSITASAVYYTNSTQVFATFNLRSRALGVYDVVLIKPDGSSAVLPNSFSIVNANNGGLITGSAPNSIPGNSNEPGCDPGAASGLNSQLVVELVVPERVLTSRPVVIQVNYHNPTNFDLPVQSRTLYSEAGMKMAFTKEGLPTGSTTLYIEFTEPGGPPGIIRTGGSGTITVHTVAPANPPDVGFVNFRLK